MPAVKSSDFALELSCPQCGAVLKLQETQCLFTCEHCKVRSIIVQKDFPEYCLPPRYNFQGSEVYFVPYWRFRGLCYVCTDEGLNPGLLEHSLIACPGLGLPFSLGLRTQTLSLHPAGQDSGVKFLASSLDSKQALKIMAKQAVKGEGSFFWAAFVGEMVSKIYAPYFIQGNRVVDGVSGKRIEQAEGLAELKKDEPGMVKFVPALCPDCGWDLSGAKDSLALHCRHCNKFWVFRNNRLVRVKAFCQTKDKSDTYLPFWRLKIATGQNELTLADIIQMANLARIVDKKAKEQAFYFFMPGFKVHPELYLNLAQKVSLFQPGSEDQDFSMAKDLFPVKLPFKEAFQAIIPLLYQLVKDKSALTPYVRGDGLLLKQASLFYLPFSRGRSEYIQEEFGLAIQKGALDFGRML